MRTITLTAVTVGDFSVQNTKITSADPLRVQGLWLEPGDILIERSNTPELVGTTRLYRGSKNFAIYPDLVIRAQLANAAVPRFVELVLQSRELRRYFQLKAKGMAGSMPKIDQQTISEAHIPLPPLAEQKRIVAKIEELFSELEAGEESLRVARRQLGVYRQSLLKQAFEGHLTAQWRTQNPDKLESWSWLTLQDVADVTGGLTKNSKRDSLPTRIPYLRVANVYANELRLDEIKDIGVTPEEAKKVRLERGDLLIVEGNGSLDQIGRVALWDGSIKNCGHQNHLIRARCRAMVSPAFVLMFLLSPRGRALIEKQAASTSGLHTLSVSKVQRLPVPLCSLPEQQEIVRLLDAQFEVIERNEREIDGALRKSEALRQVILQKAFTGRLVPQIATDEPAAELLARLRGERAAPAAGAPRKPGRSRPSVDGADWFPEIAGTKDRPRPARPARRPGTTDLQAGIVALAMDCFGRRKQFLGHTAAEKIVHLADALAGLQLDRQPVKDAAGPNDFKRAKEIEHRARIKGWFTVTNDGPVYHFHAGPNLPALLASTKRTLGPRFATVENLLEGLRGMDTRAIEIFATVHAAWNNLLLRRAPVTDEAIVTEAREDWHPHKLEIPRERFFGAIAWMRKQGFVPTGTGQPVEKPAVR